MIVEDEDDPRFVFTSILSTVQEFEVLESTDGNDCLTKLEANKDVDLVLLDIVMPTMDGIQTLTEIKKSPERYGNAKVVMLSNLGGPVAFETAINLGAIDFWMKIDTDPTMLLSKIKDVLTNPNYQPEADISNRII
jgi:CheY-like chemotaxis protein